MWTLLGWIILVIVTMFIACIAWIIGVALVNKDLLNQLLPADMNKDSSSPPHFSMLFVIFAGIAGIIYARFYILDNSWIALAWVVGISVVFGVLLGFGVKLLTSSSTSNTAINTTASGCSIVLIVPLLGFCGWLIYSYPPYTIENEADLSGYDLSGRDLSYAELRSANLSTANLSQTNLEYAYLTRADLTDANLIEANLSDAHLGNANLGGSDLSGANLSNTYLSGANLSDANLSGSDLSGANLSEADLSGANLKDAVLYETNFSKVMGLNHEMLQDAVLEGTAGGVSYWVSDVQHELSRVCEGNGIVSAATYDPEAAGPHPVISMKVMPQSSEKNESSATYVDNDFVPEKWYPPEIYDAQLVLCITEAAAGEEIIETCQYKSTTSEHQSYVIRRARHKVKIDLREAKTGQLIATDTLLGSKPDACPESGFFSGGSSTNYGDDIKPDNYIEWLRDYVE